MSQSQRTLLIIDDDGPVRHSIAAYLEDSGYRVLEAAEGPEGLAVFQSRAPDLVITDLRMADMDGLQVLQQVHEVAPDVPVIVISGAGVLGDVVSALRLGASDYLIKPIVDMEMLEHSIQKALERSALLEQNQRYRAELEGANRELREHLRVLERDQLSGRRVQRRLLPRPLQTPEGYSAAHHISPSLYLSGDFVDYAHLQKRYLAFYLADVSGHGASSAFVTIWLKHMVTRMVREEGLFGDRSTFDSGADTLLQNINRELMDTRLNHHLTLFVGVIDTETGEMRYAVAGHLPMPVLVSDDGAEFLSGSGKPVGIFREAQWQVFSRQLPERFSLVGFSDGILEILPQKNLKEKQAHLLELLEMHSQSLDQLCAALGVDETLEPPDDIAILTVIKR